MLNTTIAHYKLTTKLGQGGMGEVYRATDTKLGREVAIKVLPESLAGDVERLARFQREAELLASLNHSNIAAIYGLEESGASKALVLELVEGDTLADRLSHGPMGVEDALETCLEIAEALEAAHEKGIIHRDLKPANVKFTSDGKVKVLDFGLAKALDAEPETMISTGSLAESPTITADYTKPGTILGTAAYMSPEQARGKTLDKRTDIWSFGCVLYECLTGKKPFQGEDVSETLAKVIQGAPDWSELPRNAPPTIPLLLRRCLSKDRKRRLPDIGAARIDLGEAIEDPSSPFIQFDAGGLTQGRETSGMGWRGIGVAVIASSLFASIASWNLKQNPPISEKRADLIIDETATAFSAGINGFALSRDGKLMVHSIGGGNAGLQVRDLESGDRWPLHGSESDFGAGTSPFISRNGEDVGMVMEGNLVRLPIVDGAPHVLVEGINMSRFRGASWGDGIIVFAETLGNPLKLVSDEGGVVREITKLKDDYAHAFPQILPDGEHVLFLVGRVVNGELEGRAELLSLETGKRKLLSIGECKDARYVSSGHVIYTKGDEVFAMVWDAERLDVKGDRKRVLEGVENRRWRSQLEVSEEGTLIYESGGGVRRGQSLVWVEATDGGNPKIERFTEKSGRWNTFALSPDEKMVAIEDNGGLYIIDQRDQVRLFVTEARNPVWSGDWLYYSSEAENGLEIWKKKTDFTPGRAEKVYSEEEGFRLSSSSVGAEWLMISRKSVGGNVDIVRVNLKEGSTESELLYGEEYDELWPQISPNGRWLAYFTSELGSEIYVAPMDGNSGGQMVSNGNAFRPRWSGGGNEIYYQAGARAIHSVEVIGENGQLVKQEPIEVVRLPFSIHGYQWTVSKQRERFLMLVNTADIEEFFNEADEAATPEPKHLKVVYNWFTELNELVPLDGK